MCCEVIITRRQKHTPFPRYPHTMATILSLPPSSPIEDVDNWLDLYSAMSITGTAFLKPYRIITRDMFEACSRETGNPMFHIDDFHGTNPAYMRIHVPGKDSVPMTLKFTVTPALLLCLFGQFGNLNDVAHINPNKQIICYKQESPDRLRFICQSMTMMQICQLVNTQYVWQ